MGGASCMSSVWFVQLFAHSVSGHFPSQDDNDEDEDDNGYDEDRVITARD